MLWRKQQFTSGWNVFLREEKVSLTKRDEDGQQQAELKKTLQNSSNCAWKSSADCQENSRASEHRQRNSQENFNWRPWHEEAVCKNGPKGAHRRTRTKKSFLATKQITVLEHPVSSPDLAPSDFFLFPKIRKYWKKGILMTLMTSRVIQGQLWRPFHKTSSKIVLKGGLGAGIGA